MRELQLKREELVFEWGPSLEVQWLEREPWVVGREAVQVPSVEVLTGGESPCVGKAAGDE